MTQLLSSPSSNNKPFAHVTYVAGDTRLGDRRINVGLEAHPLYLLVRARDNDEALMAIPWTNIQDVKICIVERSYMGKARADVFSLIPLLDLTRASSDTEFGMMIVYWDVQVLREQLPIFAIGDDVKRFNRLYQAIYHYRDIFVGGTNQNGGINKR
jgi:hypothetical protein